MRSPNLDVIVALSERSRGMSPEIAVLYQDHDVASAVLVDPDGSFIDGVTMEWRDETWAPLQDGPTVTSAGGQWPSKADGGSIRAEIAGRQISIPVGREGWWTFVARISDHHLPENQLVMLEDPQ
jgi:hypothetical protein